MKARLPASPTLPRRVSLVAQTVQSLSEGIEGGHWQAQLPSERELCKHLQVSRTTLRSALEELQRKGWLDVSHRKCRRIKTKRVARARSTLGKEIVVLSPRPYAAMSATTMCALDVLRDKLAKVGCTAVIHVNPACFSGNPAPAMDQVVRAHPAAVWVVLGSKEPLQRWFIRKRIPVLVIGSCAPEFALPSLDVDLRAVCRHAAAAFLRKGHRHLALVLPKDAFGGDVVSEDGFREALETMSTTASLRVVRHDCTTAHLCSLLDAAMKATNPPTAFLVAPAMQVMTVMLHLMRRGKRIPEDISVIARGDDSVLQAATPSVAHYIINPEHFARRLSAAVRQLAETGTLPAHAIRLMPTFDPGQTVAARKECLASAD